MKNLVSGAEATTTRICPISVAIANVEGARLCYGSECMAWRSVLQWRVRSDKPWQPGEPAGNEVGPNNETREVGYCGMAGSP